MMSTRTALYPCIRRYGEMDMMEYLLTRGADINATNDVNYSALHIAVLKDQLQCIKVLLHYHCDVNLQDLQGQTALHLAIDLKNPDVVNLLCNCESIDFTLKDQSDCNALHYAVSLGNTYAVNRILTEAPYLVDDVRDICGLTVLQMAAWKGHREIAAILLSQHIPAKVDLGDRDQQTALHLATYRQHWSLVELLVRHNADISKADRHGETVLHIAIYRSIHEPVVPTPESRKDSPFIYAIWQNLARQGGKTELALACFLVSIDKSGKLLEHTTDNLKLTPLDMLNMLVVFSEFPRYVDILRSYNYFSHLG